MTTYWTIAEAAEVARVSPKRLRHLMTNGTLREGVHYTRPAGLRPRIKREPFVAWLEGDAGAPFPETPARRILNGAPAIDLRLLEPVGKSRHGV